MLKFITKTINATTRLVVGNSNPALTERTHTLDEIMNERHDLKKEGKLDLAQEAILVGRIDKAMGRPARPLPTEQATAVASMDADVEVEVVAEAEVDTPANTTYADDAVAEEVPTAEELDGAIEAALLAHAKKRDSYDKVCKGHNKNKEALKKRLAKEVEETAQAVLDAMQVAAQYEYANTASVRHKLEQANGKNVVDAVRAIMP